MKNINVRYGKPSLTNLPKKAGKKIVHEIIYAEAPDKKKLENNALIAQKKLMECMKKNG